MNKKSLKIISIFLSLILVRQDIGWTNPSLSSLNSKLQVNSAFDGDPRNSNWVDEMREAYSRRIVTDADRGRVSRFLERVGPVTGDIVRDIFGLEVPRNIRQNRLRLKRLAELLNTVEAKKAEFIAKAISPEEKLDRERALARIDLIAQVAEGLLKETPKLFNSYVAKFAEPLLREDARIINFILASTVGRRLASIKRDMDNKMGFLLQHSLKLLLKRKSEWGKAHSFFYLPGLPIVVDASGVSLQGRHKLEEAGRIIIESGWLMSNPESLRQTELIYPVEDPSPLFGGCVTGCDNNRLVIQLKDTSPREIAFTIVHEDQHVRIRSIRSGSAYNEILGISFSEKVEHYWIPSGGGPVNLLGELHAYYTGIKFYLNMWDIMEWCQGNWALSYLGSLTKVNT